jgi:chemotaxis protein CheX
MPETTFPDIETLTLLLDHAVAKVMQTLVHTNGRFIRRLAREEADGTPFYKVGSQDPLVVGSVGFTGEANGMVYLYMELELAVQIASKITGMDRAEIQRTGFDEIVKDVVGEMTNMVVGTFKNGICDLGFQCKVTLPTVLRGSQLKVESTSTAQRWTFEFTVMDRPLIADLFMQQENSG